MFFLTDAHSQALALVEEAQQSRWWVELQGHPDVPMVKVNHLMVSEGLWHAGVSSIRMLAIQFRGCATVRPFDQRQLMADMFLYKAQVLQELYERMSMERIILPNSAAADQIAEIIQQMRATFPARL